jgi:RNA polymerase sigma-70 factor (ECF subfamily)
MNNKQIERSYLKYKNHIYNFILRLANDHEIAMDVTQQTFLNALSYDTKVHLTKLWYLSLARNIYYVEKNRTKNITFDSIDQSKDFVFINEQSNQLPTSTALKELQLSIEQSLFKMSTTTKEILILYFIENLSIIEISGITKRSIIDIKVNLHHARLLFEHSILKNMRTKISPSNDHCEIYFQITKNVKQTVISKAKQIIINKHISNCKRCCNSDEQLKRTGILLNLTPLFKAPAILDKIVYNAVSSGGHSKNGLANQSNINSAKILPFINPLIIGFIIIINFGRLNDLNTFF